MAFINVSFHIIGLFFCFFFKSKDCKSELLSNLLKHFQVLAKGVVSLTKLHIFMSSKTKICLLNKYEKVEDLVLILVVHH